MQADQNIKHDDGEGDDDDDAEEAPNQYDEESRSTKQSSISTACCGAFAAHMQGTEILLSHLHGYAWEFLERILDDGQRACSGSSSGYENGRKCKHGHLEWRLMWHNDDRQQRSLRSNCSCHTSQSLPAPLSHTPACKYCTHRLRFPSWPPPSPRPAASGASATRSQGRTCST